MHMLTKPKALTIKPKLSYKIGDYVGHIQLHPSLDKNERRQGNQAAVAHNRLQPSLNNI